MTKLSEAVASLMVPRQFGGYRDALFALAKHADAANVRMAALETRLSALENQMSREGEGDEPRTNPGAELSVDLHTIPTADLVDELTRRGPRRGITEIAAPTPEHAYRIQLTDMSRDKPEWITLGPAIGPARILVVTD